MSGNQQFSLRWNDYQAHLVSAFESLRDDNEFVDLTLSCEGRKISAHKMLLSACSPYFRDLLKDNPCPHPIIILRETAYDDLFAILQFMYNGEVRIHQNQLNSFVKTAKTLQIRGLSGDNNTRPSLPEDDDDNDVDDNGEDDQRRRRRRDLDDALPKQKKRSSPSSEAPSSKRNSSKKTRTEDNNFFLKEEALDFEDGVDGGGDGDEDEDDFVPGDAVEVDYGGGDEGNMDNGGGMLIVGMESGPPSLANSSSAIITEDSSEELSHCGQTFSSHCEWTQHFLECHPLELPCQYCKKTFRNPISIRQHLQVHRGETKCCICHKMYNRKYDLRKHQKTQHNIHMSVEPRSTKSASQEE